MGAYRKKEIIEKKVFGRPTKYNFESIIVNGVEHYDMFLTSIYGDWRKMPPKEERRSGHEYLTVDLHRSWMD